MQRKYIKKWRKKGRECFKNLFKGIASDELLPNTPENAGTITD